MGLRSADILSSGAAISNADAIRVIKEDVYELGDATFVTDKLRHLVFLLAGQVGRLEKRVSDLEKKVPWERVPE